VKTVFGPIDSWQLGKAIGVDIVAADHRYCSFDCTYCPHGKSTKAIAKRRWVVGVSELQAQLERVEPGQATCVAFTGKGEPTLASNLGQAIDLARSLLGLPVAVLTNSSLIPRDDVRGELAKADMVLAKLDAPDDELFRAINRPSVPYTQADIFYGLREFRRTFRGRLVLHVTFVEANKSVARTMAILARELSPDEIQFNAPLPCSAEPLSAADVQEINKQFEGLNVVGPRDGVSWPLTVVGPVKAGTLDVDTRVTQQASTYRHG
jgi:wyosine [tRNA(Phe)-imidazoG37] synthetase (radical SAM superfamily)